MITIIVAAVAVLLLPAIALVVMYNRFVRQRTLIDNSWAGVDVELTRRHDLIPNLVATVQGYAAHEKDLLTSLVAAREAAAALEKQAPQGRSAVEETMGRSLAAVLARVEAYPNLKADTGFLDLQKQLVETEDRIAAARRFYNLNVGAFNTRVGTFPSNLVADWFGFVTHPFFELSDTAARTVPQVGL
ncbi:LemA family protein [Nocardioides marmorisolisilvae]|uniref:LemA family protein n=1 Tax=Nocardioides marmorisolisilvae TaxID=1542737 RepID=UPI001616E2FC|nr:LemA family protein [Nocardioides marmorisolisilvae]